MLVRSVLGSGGRAGVCCPTAAGDGQCPRDPGGLAEVRWKGTSSRSKSQTCIIHTCLETGETGLFEGLDGASPSSRHPIAGRRLVADGVPGIGP